MMLGTYMLQNSVEDARGLQAHDPREHVASAYSGADQIPRANPSGI